MAKLTRPTADQVKGRAKSLLADAIDSHLSGFVDLMPIDAVADFGLVADFNPTTGKSNGTNNTVAFQKMMDNVVAIGGNCKIRIPAGSYRFSKVEKLDGSVTVALGRQGAGLKNVIIEGDGFSTRLHHDDEGTLFGVMSAEDVTIRRLSVIGYGAGRLAAGREHDHGFALGYNCRGVTFDEVYIDNCMGDCIYMGGDLNNGAITGKLCRDITVRNSVLKERYGNGVRSWASGSRSRLAMAVIDIVGLKVHDNIIFGEIDLEPNATGQNIQYVHIHDNDFRAGDVLPVDNPYQCEPLYQAGGKTIRGGVTSQSVSDVTSAMITVENNIIQYGRFRLTARPSHGYMHVKNNRIRRGAFFLGHYSGTNSNPALFVQDNHVDAPFNGMDDENMEDWITGSVPAGAFIIQGGLSYARISDNTCGGVDSGFSYMFYLVSDEEAGRPVGVGGRNVWSGNKAITTQSLRNYTVAATDIDIGNVVMPSSGRAKVTTTNTITGIQYGTVFNKDITGAASLNFNEMTSNKVRVTHSASATLSAIIGSPNTELGTEVQIRSATANASNTLTLANSSGFYLKGGADVVIDSARKVVTMQLIEPDIWTEISRNF